jgi:hypothetical protein
MDDYAKGFNLTEAHDGRALTWATDEESGREWWYAPRFGQYALRTEPVGVRSVEMLANAGAHRREFNFSPRELTSGRHTCITPLNFPHHNSSKEAE